jgi:hypothetical protein
LIKDSTSWIAIANALVIGGFNCGFNDFNEFVERNFSISLYKSKST